METMTTTHGCDLAAVAPKAYVLLPAGLPRSTGGVRLRAADVSVLGLAIGTFLPTTAPPGPPF